MAKKGKKKVIVQATEEPDHEFPIKIRMAREARGLSQRELAKRCDLANTTISMIEKGKISPSLSTIKRILDGLSMTLADFFANQPSDSDTIFYRSTELVRLMRHHGVELRQIGADLRSRQMQILRGVYAPGAQTGPEPLVHDGEEGGYVIRGTFEFVVGKEKRTLRPGDAYYFRSNTPHRFKNVSDVEGEIISAQTPPSV